MAEQDALAQAQQQEEQRQQMEERKALMLQSLLTPEAKERLARIALVKPDKAGEVTDRLLAMAQRGSVTERISEAALKRMIEQVNEGSHTAHHTRITYQRKKFHAEESDEEYDL